MQNPEAYKQLNLSIPEWAKVHTSLFNEDNYKRTLLFAITEVSLVIRFLGLSHKLGYSLPLKGFNPIDMIHNIITSISFPDVIRAPEVWDTASIVAAQHHGVPTRLLDWTTNPLRASLFAIEQAFSLNDDKRAEEIAVFAIKRDDLRKNNFGFAKTDVQYTPNITAQSGELTFDKFADKFFYENGYYASVEKRMYDISSTSNISIRKITLPMSSVRNLFTLLWANDTTFGHIYPGFSGVGKSVTSLIEVLHDTEIYSNDDPPTEPFKLRYFPE